MRNHDIVTHSLVLVAPFIMVLASIFYIISDPKQIQVYFNIVTMFAMQLTLFLFVIRENSAPLVKLFGRNFNILEGKCALPFISALACLLLCPDITQPMCQNKFKCIYSVISLVMGVLLLICAIVGFMGVF